MTQPSLLALGGLARAGKDSLAGAFTDHRIYNFSHPIKAFFADFIAGEQGIFEVKQKILGANPLLTFEQLEAFTEDVLMPFFIESEACYDAFTEYDPHKKLIRPILEHGGELIYDHVFQAYFAEVDAALERGQKIINTRLVRLPEAHAWVERGGLIYVIERKDWPAASEWEANYLRELQASGLVTATLHNDGTAEEWEAFSRRFARSFTAPAQESA